MPDIKTLPDNQKPRERLNKYGPECLSDTEILELLISSGSQDRSVSEIADDIIHEIDGNLFELANYTPEQFQRKGINIAKSSQLIAAVELGKRILTRKSEGRLNINNPEDIKNLFEAEIRSLTQELLLIIMLNAKRQVLRKVTVSIGNATSSMSSPRDVFACAIKCGANAIILAHNHPSGDPTPSDSDLNVTKQLVNAGKLMDVPVLDHIIIGIDGFYSFRGNGMI